MSGSRLGKFLDGAYFDCEVGAMPPFGNLYEIEGFVDPSLAEDEQIAFNAGTHAELIQMSFTDYRRLVKLRIVELVQGQVATR
ncbi:MAG: YbaK/EbsC family protein [Phycisphaerae bacterium]|nr:YbaK/EbsC family protein [Phycisphaerae bacterium]